MQTFPDIKQLLIYSSPESVPGIDENNWSHWAVFPNNWVLEWDFDEGISFQIENEQNEPCEWRPRTWNLYAPNVKYRVNYKYRTRRHENIYILWGMNKPQIPGIDRNLTIIGDYESRIADTIRQMYLIQQSGFPGYKELLNFQMLTLLAEIRCSTFSEGKGTLDSPFLFKSIQQENTTIHNPSLLERVDDAIIRNIYRTPTIEELARFLNMSCSSLSHHFKQETNWTIIERVRWQRIQQSKKMLLQSNRHSAIKDTAKKLRFSSQFYFSKVFKEVTGISPNEFLRIK